MQSFVFAGFFAYAQNDIRENMRNYLMRYVYLQDKYKIGKAFLFIGFIPQNQDLYTSLQKSGYILVFKPTLQLPDGKVKGNVDAELVLHAMIEYPNYDKALIVTGDGDFYCLIDYLVKNDKMLKLMIPNRYRYSSLFRKLMPHIVFMNELKGKMEHRGIKKEALPRGRNPSDSL